MFSGKTIFFAALDWGFGHVTRSAVLLQQLSADNAVIVGVTTRNQFFYEQNFPALQQVQLPSYDVRYSSFLPAWGAVLLQGPRVWRVIQKERRVLEQFLETQKVHVIISDNRFGIRNKNVTSIVITHQLRITGGPFASLATSINQRLLNRFDEVWVPDYEKEHEKLSGQLSSPAGITKTVRFIGPLSWLSQQAPQLHDKFDILILLSGEEPQRSILEKKLLLSLEKVQSKIVLVRGTRSMPLQSNKQVEVYDFADAAALAGLVSAASLVICRSGYSTLMDLHLLHKNKMLLIPTPGQPEQEYLAEYWERCFGASVLEQGEIEAEGLGKF